MFARATGAGVAAIQEQGAGTVLMDDMEQPLTNPDTMTKDY